LSTKFLNADLSSATRDPQGTSSIPDGPSRDATPPAQNESFRRAAFSPTASTVQVSICIVNHNNRELLSQCIDSIVAQGTDVSIEVLVADNGSTDDSVVWLKREHPQVRLFEYANIGFSRANNRLVSQARGWAILLLNNDCLLEKGSLRKLLDLMEGDARIGMLGCRIVTGEGILQPTFLATSLSHFLLPNPVEIYRAHLLTFGKNLDKRRQAVKAYETRHGYDRFCEVESICGVCVLIRRNLLETVGLLDENFFMYYEDADLCLRAREAGWKVCYTPEVCAHHFVRRKQEKGSNTLLAEARFSQYYFVRKHHGLPWAVLIALRYLLQFVLSILPGSFLFVVRRKSFREYLAEINSQWKALSWIFLPDSRKP
jgi:GT2 family glycosyltransferase